MLIDHAQAKRIGVGRAGDVHLPAVNQNAAAVGPVVAEQAFHQGGLAGAVLTEQAMHRTGADGHADIVQGGETAEAFAYAERLDADGLRHGRWARKASESLTAPNTPPCIGIMASAAWWLARSVAPQQSPSNRHSKPRSLASRIVV